MAAQMTSKERIKRMFEHQTADRIPIMDYPWDTTIKRWHSEGMPVNVEFHKYFGIDKIETIPVNSSPRYDYEVLEETSDFTIYRNCWGTISKLLKDDRAAMPQFLDFVGKTNTGWKEMKNRMEFSEDRIPWEFLKQNFRQWKNDDNWIQAQIEFGFNVVSAYITGMEGFMYALAEDPDWCFEMMEHGVDLNLKLLDRLWDEGYRFDSVFWCDDMGYKGTTFFSVDTYRDFLKPAHKKAVEWAHNKGLKAHLHSCGNVMNFVPEFIDLGIDGLNPLEVKAGMDPAKLKNEYGDKLLLHGGINSMLWTDIDVIEEEMRQLVPVLMESGGFIFSSDHSVPMDVSLDNFTKITDLVKKIGRY
ncbi:MAG: uroporphyrinogen decarboxylase family protein [Saccharofermentanales bacterium]